MTCKPLTVLVPNLGPAGLPLPLTAQASLEPESPTHPAHWPDATAIEDASCPLDPGSIEFDSWVAQLRHPVR